MAEEVDALKGEDCRAAWGCTWGKWFRLEGLWRMCCPHKLDTATMFCLLSFAFLVAKGILLHSELYNFQEYKCRSWTLSQSYFSSVNWKKEKEFYLAKKTWVYTLWDQSNNQKLAIIPMSIWAQLPLLYCFNCWLLVVCNCCKMMVQKPRFVFSLVCFVSPSLGPERLVNIVRVVCFLCRRFSPALFISWRPCYACRWQQYGLSSADSVVDNSGQAFHVGFQAPEGHLLCLAES